jgi:hypothetical protein
MRIAAAILFALLLISLRANTGVSPTNANLYVSFSAALKKGTPREGPGGAILFTLHPRKGIHINLTPPMSVTFDSSSAVKAADTLETPAMEKFPYLDASKAVVQKYTLVKPSRSAALTIKGTLTYFYCSDSEGWCSKFKQPFALTVPAAK